MSTLKKLFLIDDDEDDRLIFHEALHELNLAVECYYAPDAVTALTKLQENSLVLPDYIFLDLNMPSITGRQFLVTLKQTAAFRHIPVVILSTSQNPHDIEETKQLGAFHFIIKPSTVKELSRRLAHVFSKNGHSTNGTGE